MKRPPDGVEGLKTFLLTKSMEVIDHRTIEFALYQVKIRLVALMVFRQG